VMTDRRRERILSSASSGHGHAMTIDDLGPRICIMGPSNSGKSTLAEAIVRARDLPLVPRHSGYDSLAVSG
jgi:serine kinase of HPr protein (carbohydrate metabolism regulator)